MFSPVASHSQRFITPGAIRTSSTPRIDMPPPRYVSPTYRSNVFSHLREDNDSSLSMQSFQHGLSLQQSCDETRIPGRRGCSTTKHSHVLPTVSEWIPRRSNINDPEIYEKIEQEALINTQKKIEQSKAEVKEKKEMWNREYRNVLKSLEKKHETRLDHKKPKEIDLREFNEMETEYSSHIAQKTSKIIEEKMDLGKILEQQIEEKNRQKQLEIQNQKNDTRTGFELKPRQSYDMEEYKRILQRQLEEKQQRKALLAKSKEEERNARLRDLEEQEAAMNAKATYRKAQSVEYGAEKLRDLQDVGARKLTEDVEASEVSYKEEKLTRRSSAEIYGSRKGNTGRNGLNLLQEEEEFSGEVKRKSVQVTSPTRFFVPGKQEKKNDWESATKVLLQKKEQQEEYLKELKEQILARKKSKQAEVMREKHEEKSMSGLKLGGYKPKETVVQVAEVVKKQMAEKEESKKKEIKVKKDHTVNQKDVHRNDEMAFRKQYEDIQKQKVQMFTQYKKDVADASRNKKGKGVTTIKI